MKTKNKIIVFITILFIFVLFLSIYLWKHQKTTNVQKYESYLNKVRYAKFYFPKINELGNYKKITLTYKHTRELLFFTTKSIGLFVNYSEEEYNTVKENVISTYSFYEEEVEKLLKHPTAEFRNYNFKIVDSPMCYDQSSENCNKYELPKFFEIIGFNDQQQKLTFIFIDAEDLDWIDELKEILERYVYF